ncbi:hypothetical protein GH714_014044 [Hevea brasiliensis]|uniref:DUF7579 domain-containing protein n=1 Tax=Hevea brasiliensis TaxID=3981 RepID=A0A6A6K5K7_HEVBR|nr:hypothetical protein GH714_014044 [Hevea brasiliensis]
MDGMQKSKEYDGCGAYGDDCALGFQDIIVADASSGYEKESPLTHMSIKNICTNSHSFCFPSTLPGLPSNEQEHKADAVEVARSLSDSPSVGPTQDSKGASNRRWFSDSGVFELLNGRTVSCSLNSMEGINQLSSMQNGSANQNDISSCRGPLLTKKSASFRLNTDSEMTKSSPFDVSVSPHTSSGGFLIQVKGYATESPYKISPVISVDAASSGRLIRNLSLFNPFNENLYVREISTWILVSQGNISHHTEAICSVENFQDSNRLSLLSVKDWLVVKSGEADFTLMAIRLHENWEIGPHGSETVIEIDLSFESEVQIVGSFCMQLLRASQDKSDTILVPLEINLDGKGSYNGISSSVSVSLEALVSCDASNTFVAISLRNAAPHVFTFVKISEVAPKKVFLFKYMQGLLLFPGTVTLAATITCTQLLVELHDPVPEISNIYKNCKVVVLTNDTSSPQIEIPCQSIIHICLRHQKDSSIGIDHQSEKAESGSRRSGSLGSSRNLPLKVTALET